jgi:pyruvate carboxylase
MVSAGLTRDEVEDPDRDVAFPDSVVKMFHGDLGQPPGGWPKALQKKILKGAEPITVRPGSVAEPMDLDAEREAAEKAAQRQVSDEEFNSYLMYPKVFADYVAHRRVNGPVQVLDTPTFLYGMKSGDEIAIEIEKGKTLVVQCLVIGEPDAEGEVKVFFELNGQPRTAKVPFRAMADTVVKHPKAEPGNPAHVASPMPGMVASVAVKAGQKIKAGDVLLVLEAMKMETAVHAEHDGTVEEVVAGVGTQVDAKDLMVRLGVG